MLATTVAIRTSTFIVPTRKQQREMRIAGLRSIAESLGLRWGGVKRGVVTVYFGDGPCKLRSLQEAEHWLTMWQQRDAEGDRSWYENNMRAFNPRQEQPNADVLAVLTWMSSKPWADVQAFIARLAA